MSGQGRRIVPAPTDAEKQWVKTGSTGACSDCAVFYPELAQTLEIPLLEKARTHVWRSTLSKRYEESDASREYISAILGQCAETNETYHTDQTDLDRLVDTYRTARSTDQEAS